MNKPQINDLPLAILSENHDVFVCAPDRLFNVSLSLLEVLSKLSHLPFVKPEFCFFVGNIFPSEHFPGIIPEKIRSFGRYPNERAFERSSR